MDEARRSLPESHRGGGSIAYIYRTTTYPYPRLERWGSIPPPWTIRARLSRERFRVLSIGEIRLINDERRGCSLQHTNEVGIDCWNVGGYRVSKGIEIRSNRIPAHYTQVSPTHHFPIPSLPPFSLPFHSFPFASHPARERWTSFRSHPGCNPPVSFPFSPPFPRGIVDQLWLWFFKLNPLASFSARAEKFE